MEHSITRQEYIKALEKVQERVFLMGMAATRAVSRSMKALLERGLRVPDDVAVAGFDDIPLASFVNPGLSTVQQDTKRAGALLVETLLALIHGEPAESQTIPVKLALRGSTAAK